MHQQLFRNLTGEAANEMAFSSQTLRLPLKTIYLPFLQGNSAMWCQLPACQVKYGNIIGQKHNTLVNPIAPPWTYIRNDMKYFKSFGSNSNKNLVFFFIFACGKNFKRPPAEFPRPYRIRKRHLHEHVYTYSIEIIIRLLLRRLDGQQNVSVADA